MTKLLFQVVTQSRHPLTSLVWSKYRPKVKQNNLKKCLVNIFSCQQLVGVVTVQMTVVDQAEFVLKKIRTVMNTHSPKAKFSP